MKKITPPHYEKPQMVIVELVTTVSFLEISPGNGQGKLPPIGNNNSDSDW